jgi:hypothetical protein
MCSFLHESYIINTWRRQTPAFSQKITQPKLEAMIQETWGLKANTSILTEEILMARRLLSSYTQTDIFIESYFRSLVYAFYHTLTQYQLPTLLRLQLPPPPPPLESKIMVSHSGSMAPLFRPLREKKNPRPLLDMDLPILNRPARQEDEDVLDASFPFTAKTVISWALGNLV